MMDDELEADILFGREVKRRFEAGEKFTETELITIRMVWRFIYPIIKEGMKK